MQRGVITKLTVYQDRPVSLSSTVFGANLNAVAFNVDLIRSKDAKLANELVLLFDKCKKLRSK